MVRIKIKDLPRNKKISKAEMKNIFGGPCCGIVVDMPLSKPTGGQQSPEYLKMFS
ncbi:MAG: hypothetical protein AB1765_13105 [Candidatus Hydrogenedentota bacterium]